MRRAERKRLVEVIVAKLPREVAMLIQWIDLGALTQEEVVGILNAPAEHPSPWPELTTASRAAKRKAA